MKKRKHKEKNKVKKHSPEYDVDFRLMSKIAYQAWPKEEFNTIEGVYACKLFYNISYNKFQVELQETLDKYHPAAWVREAYIQLEIWSLLFFNHQNKTDFWSIEGPAFFAPIGRYGWRYIIEISSEKFSKAVIESAQRPSKADINKVFTTLVALSYCSEYSNYLHYFQKELSSANVRLSPYVFTKGLEFNKEQSDFYDNIINYISLTPDWNVYKEFSVDNETLMRMINEMLLKHFSFSFTEAQALAEIFLEVVAPSIGASILVTTYDKAVEHLSDVSGISIQKIKSILNFILFDTGSTTYQERDFLSRSQNERMLNFSGAIIYLEKYMESIYDPKSAKLSFVINSSKHIILTGTLMLEWLDVFVSRLVFGQRQDLKNINSAVNQDISSIESFFHRNIFENELKNLITRKGFYCTSIEKVNGTPIPCGEIDIVAYNPVTKFLSIIEAKNHAPAKDARSMGKVISDHFRQKKYHQKFNSKIEWVSNNLDSLRKIFKEKFHLDLAETFKIKSYFVTGSPNTTKFLTSEYEVCTFYELDKILNEKE